MAFSINLDALQVSEIVCEELGRIIKVEIDRKKDGLYCDDELIKSALTILRQYISDSEHRDLIEAINRYTDQ